VESLAVVTQVKSRVTRFETRIEARVRVVESRLIPSHVTTHKSLKSWWMKQWKTPTSGLWPSLKVANIIWFGYSKCVSHYKTAGNSHCWKIQIITWFNFKCSTVWINPKIASLTFKTVDSSYFRFVMAIWVICTFQVFNWYILGNCCSINKSKNGIADACNSQKVTSS